MGQKSHLLTLSTGFDPLQGHGANFLYCVTPMTFLATRLNSDRTFCTAHLQCTWSPSDKMILRTVQQLPANAMPFLDHNKLNRDHGHVVFINQTALK